MITADELRGLLDYDKATGLFTWRRPVGTKIRAGQRAGALSAQYISIGVLGKRYYAHRLAWLWVTGCWPTSEIDHINMLRTDNRWDNLREADRSQNAANIRARANNKLGIKGVSFCKQTERWRAQITLRGRAISIGRFDTPNEAQAAYVAKSQELFGQYARAT